MPDPPTPLTCSYGVFLSSYSCVCPPLVVTPNLGGLDSPAAACAHTAPGGTCSAAHSCAAGFVPEAGWVSPTPADTSIVAGRAGSVKGGLLALAVAAGLQVMTAMMEESVTAVAGPKGRHQPERTAVRHGTEAGSVVLAGC